MGLIKTKTNILEFYERMDAHAPIPPKPAIISTPKEVEKPKTTTILERYEHYHLDLRRFSNIEDKVGKSVSYTPSNINYENQAISVKDNMISFNKDGKSVIDNTSKDTKTGKTVTNNMSNLVKIGKDVQNNMTVLPKTGLDVKNNMVVIEKVGKDVQDNTHILEKTGLTVKDNTKVVEKIGKDVKDNTILLPKVGKDVKDNTTLKVKIGKDVKDNTILAEKIGKDVRDNTTLIEKTGLTVIDNTRLLPKVGKDVRDNTILVEKTGLSVQNNMVVPPKEGKDVRDNTVLLPKTGLSVINNMRDPRRDSMMAPTQQTLWLATEPDIAATRHQFNIEPITQYSRLLPNSRDIDNQHIRFGYGENYPGIVRQIGQRWDTNDDKLKKYNFNSLNPIKKLQTGSERTVADFVRLGKFMTSGQGLLWIAQQEGRQLTNPKTEVLPGQLIQHQRIFNPLGVIGSALGSQLGIRFYRHGFFTDGLTRNYEEIVRELNNSTKIDLKLPEPITPLPKYAANLNVIKDKITPLLPFGNRMLRMASQLRGLKYENEPSTTEAQSTKLKVISKFTDKAISLGNKILDLKAKVQKSTLGKKLLGTYNGEPIIALSGLAGPKSLYGIGFTTITADKSGGGGTVNYLNQFQFSNRYMKTISFGFETDIFENSILSRYLARQSWNQMPSLQIQAEPTDDLSWYNNENAPTSFVPSGVPLFMASNINISNLMTYDKLQKEKDYQRLKYPSAAANGVWWEAAYSHSNSPEMTNRIGVADVGADVKIKDKIYDPQYYKDFDVVKETTNWGDLIQFVIGGIRFRAYIEMPINESIRPEWTSINYVGRPDEFYIYKKVSREIQITFYVPILFGGDPVTGATGEREIVNFKLNQLKKLTYPSWVNNRMVSPIIKLKVGNIIRQQMCHITSLTYEYGPSDAPWDIWWETPMVYKVQASFQLYGMDGGIVGNYGSYTPTRNGLDGFTSTTATDSNKPAEKTDGQLEADANYAKAVQERKEADEKLIAANKKYEESKLKKSTTPTQNFNLAPKGTSLPI